MATTTWHRMKHGTLSLLLLAPVMGSQSVWAQGAGSLPEAEAPDHGGGSAEDDWLATMEGYLFDGAVVLATVVSLAGFIWVAWAGLTKFNEARNGRAEWGEVGLLGIAGGVTLLVVTFLLTTATNDVIGTGGGGGGGGA